LKNIQGDYGNGFETASRGPDVARKISHRGALWKLLATVGVALRAMGQSTQARQAFEESIAVIETMRDLAGEASTNNKHSLKTRFIPTSRW